MRRIKKIALFFARFFLVFVVLQSLVWFADLGFLEEGIAGIEAGMAGGQAKGNLVLLGGQAFEITSSCTGLVSASILAAVVFSIRKPKLKQKLKIFFLGAITLFFLNIPRIYFVLLIGKIYGSSAAELAHELTWLSTAAFILLAWHYFTKKIAKVKQFNELL